MDCWSIPDNGVLPVFMRVHMVLIYGMWCAVHDNNVLVSAAVVEYNAIWVSQRTCKIALSSLLTFM